MSLLQLEGLTTRLASEAGWVHALDDIALTIEKGQTFALVGESGCGKSMTALSIARLLPDCGAIVAGQVQLSVRPTQKEGTSSQDLLQLPESAMRLIRGKRVSMIFQEPGTSLNPVLTVGQQITEAITLHTGCSPIQARDQALQWLIKVGIPEPERRLDQYPFQLSGGQKQRVMIAMALAVKPDLLIADEPTTALDVSIQAQVLELLKTLQREQGMGMLLITHDLAIVQQMADRVGLMYAGQLVEMADSETFFSKPTHPYALALLKSLPASNRRGAALYALEGRVPSLVKPAAGCRFKDRCALAQDTCVEAVGLAEVGQGHLVRCAFAKSPNILELRQGIGTDTASIEPPSLESATLEPRMYRSVLQTVGLSVSYAHRSGMFSRQFTPVLHGLDLNLQEGRTVALVGESGSGKTTAARALLGLLPGDAKVNGDVLLHGRPLSQWPSAGSESWRTRVQFVFQDPFASLNPRHRIREIIEEPLLMLRPDLDASQRAQRIIEVVDQVSMAQSSLDRFAHEFSGGQRQRLAIARALAPAPSVLICDEPTSALDVSVQAQILNLLRQLQQQMGLAMLFITHNLAVVEYLADEVLVLKDGKVIERGNAQRLFANPQSAYTQELLRSAPRLQF